MQSRLPSRCASRPAEREQFDRDGYVVREGAFDAAALADMRETVEVVVADVIEDGGGIVPPADSELHLPRARFHAQLARDFGLPDLVQPMYLRVPDVDRTRA